MFPGIIWWWDNEPGFEWFALGAVHNGESCQTNHDRRHDRVIVRERPIETI